MIADEGSVSFFFQVSVVMISGIHAVASMVCHIIAGVGSTIHVVGELMFKRLQVSAVHDDARMVCHITAAYSYAHVGAVSFI